MYARTGGGEVCVCVGGGGGGDQSIQKTKTTLGNQKKRSLLSSHILSTSNECGFTALLYITIIIRKFSIALFPAEQAQHACSHTCT